jgi:hypothetical protein
LKGLSLLPEWHGIARNHRMNKWMHEAHQSCPEHQLEFGIEVYKNNYIDWLRLFQGIMSGSKAIFGVLNTSEFVQLRTFLMIEKFAIWFFSNQVIDIDIFEMLLR